MIAERVPGARVLFVAAVTLVSSCSPLAIIGGGGNVEPVPVPAVHELDRGAILLASGAFDAAEMIFRQVASSCENGSEGRRSLLLLAALRIDSRNPAAHADSAAAFAIRYLSLPDAEAFDRPLAESLYLMALDRGANPAFRPVPVGGPGTVATRFSACDAPPAAPREFPILPTLGREPLWATEMRLRAQRDSLVERVTELEEVNVALDQRVRELDAELQRILRTLGGPPPEGETTNDPTGPGPG